MAPFGWCVQRSASPRADCPGHGLASDTEMRGRAGRGPARVRGVGSSAAALGRRSAWPNAETSRMKIILKGCSEGKVAFAKTVVEAVT